MIIRRKHSGDFAIIPNGTANDENLKADALGVLVYLLAKPHDWKVIIADLRKRFGIGRNRVYAILNELAAVGYVQRTQRRDDECSRFVDVEYIVFDMPIAGKTADDPELQKGGDSPLPQIGEPENPQQITASLVSGSPPTVMRNSGRIIRTDYIKPLSEENSASVEAGAAAPSASKMIWDEGRDLLKQSSSKPSPSIIGRWLKRTASDEAKEKLLGMIRAAAKAGTGDPVGYVTAALNREFPPPVDPRTFDPATWKRNAQAAVKTKAWSAAWGPKPGAKGCLMPAQLVTAELIKALSERRIAA